MPRTSPLVFIQASFPTLQFRAACDCKLFGCLQEETRASLPQGSFCSSMSICGLYCEMKLLMKMKWEHSRKNNLQMIFLSIFLTSSQVKKLQVVIILTAFSYLLGVFFSLFWKCMSTSENYCLGKLLPLLSLILLRADFAAVSAKTFISLLTSNSTLSLHCFATLFLFFVPPANKTCSTFFVCLF